MTQQVKICPKCGTENKSDNNACVACFTSLTAVPTTLSDKPEPTYTPPAEAPSAPEPTPITQGPPGPGATREMPSSGPIPGGPIIPPPGTYAPQRTKSGAGAVVGWIIAIVVIGGLAFGGWWFFMKPASPDQVVQQWIDAQMKQDVDKIISVTSKVDLDAEGGEQVVKGELEKMKGVPGAFSTVTGKTGTVRYEGEDTALVEVALEGPTADRLAIRMGADYKPKVVTVREDGKWKISLRETVKRMRDDALERIRANGGSAFPGGGAPPGSERRPVPNRPIGPR